MKDQNKIIIYTASDGQTKIEVKLENEMLWLSQDKISELFGKSRSTITEHINNIFKDGELDEKSVCRFFRRTGHDGKKYQVKHYNLDAIISVGYRVNSIRGTQFRIWATQKLKEYIVKGFVLDDNRLAGGKTNKTYFQELETRIRLIRTSEANFYQKVKDIFATSVDYNPQIDYAKQFFAIVQNKFHFAIAGLTASEIISSRIDSTKDNLGLTNWQGEIITRDQAEVAKNYLEELEARRLHLLVEQFLSYAELQSVEERLMYMKDWVKQLDDFLIFNKRQVLTNSGSVSHHDMEEKVRVELAKYNQKLLG